MLIANDTDGRLFERGMRSARWLIVFGSILSASARLASAAQMPRPEGGQSIESDSWRVEWDQNTAVALPKTGKEAVLVFKASGNPHWHSEYSLLSLVGSWVSVEERDHYYENDPPFDKERYFHVYDLSRSEKSVLEYLEVSSSNLVKLTDIFEEKDLFEAINGDSYVQKLLKGTKVTNLQEILAKLESSCDLHILSSFAFHHVKDGKVTVRIALDSDCSTRPAFTQIGVYLPIPEKWRAQFALAVRHGTLMRSLAK